MHNTATVLGAWERGDRVVAKALEEMVDGIGHPARGRDIEISGHMQRAFKICAAQEEDAGKGSNDSTAACVQSIEELDDIVRIPIVVRHKATKEGEYSTSFLWLDD